MAKRSSKIAKKIIETRDRLFPTIPTDDFWNRTTVTGFTSIPRTLPIVINIINDLTKGKPAGSTYLTLWATVFDEMYINLQNPTSLAYHSGFSGQRAVRTWQERMRSLDELGFIKTAPGTIGDLSHAVILNPHFVIRRLAKKGQAGLTDSAYNSLLERAIDIGAKDMTDPLPEERDPDDEIPF